MNLLGKKILLGITGGIAAYKTCDLIRQLIRAGADVKAVLTPCALNFVTETTLRTLTKNPVYIHQFEEFEWKPGHISLSDEADMFVIAPASANTIGKIANGICDNLLTSLIVAFDKPIIIVPAMNCKMWENKFVQENLAKLVNSGFHLVPPEEGELACGYAGAGRFAGIDKIYSKICEALEQENFLQGKKIIITAGGTKEPIDPVRYIGNRSSGKMGIAIADAAYNYGAKVCLISTFKAQKPYETIEASTAEKMLEVLKEKFPAVDVLVMSAAVSDYRVKEIADNKIKKDDRDEVNIELVKNPDILGELSKIKQPSQMVVGFCAETENLEQNAIKKLRSKNLDFIVANDVSREDIGLESDYNAVTIINRENLQADNISRMPKTEIAKLLLKRLFLPSTVTIYNK